MKKRLVGIDTVSGIMLIWMMYVVHLARISGINTPFLHFSLSIMSCFMPWFYFKAGLLFNSDKPFKSGLKGDIMRLLIPFLIFSAIGWGGIYIGGNLILGNSNLSSLIEDSLNSFLWYGAFNGNFALWFLLSLLFVKFLFRGLFLLKVPLWLILSLSFLGVAFFVASHFNRFLYIGNICNGLFFFALGVLSKNVLLHKYVVWVSLFCFIPQLFFPTYLDFRASEKLGALPFPIIELSCLGACILFNYFFTVIYPQPVKLITYIGKNSMRYYVVHYMIISMSIQLIEHTSLGNNPILKFFFSAVVLTVALFIFDKLTQFRIVKLSLGELKR